MSAATDAFPDLISTVEFERGLPFLFRPGATEADQGLPPSRAAEGPSNRCIRHPPRPSPVLLADLT